MARRKRITLERIKCPRCGKTVLSASRPISSQAAFDKFRGICDNCITPDEEREMLEMQAAGHLSMAKKKG